MQMRDVDGRVLRTEFLQMTKKQETKEVVHLYGITFERLVEKTIAVVFTRINGIIQS